MNHGSLFSGIGGFDLAADWMGWENIFHCEWNSFGQKILKHYWPKAISYDDITKTDFSIHRGTIDILSGGFPCQPYSVAGLRKGKNDERHLWPHMLRAIRESQPRWVVGENVLGLVGWNGGLVFEEVQADLEAEGYEVQPYILPAAAINAPHRRDRVWFVGYAKHNGLHAAEIRRDEPQPPFETRKNQKRQFAGANCLQSGFIAHAPIKRLQIPGQTGIMQLKKEIGERLDDRFEQLGRPDEHTNSKRLQECHISEITNQPSGFGCIGHHESRVNWQNFPTESPVCDGDDGISSKLDGITFPKWRDESIKGGGNAIVPQLVLQIFKAIENYEKIHDYI